MNNDKERIVQSYVIVHNNWKINFIMLVNIALRMI